MSEVEERCRRADAGIVHQQRNARVRTQHGLDPSQIRLLAEIGCDRLDRSLCLVSQALCQRHEPGPAEGDQDQVIAAPGHAVGVDRADARGGTGDQCRALLFSDAHSYPCWSYKLDCSTSVV